MDDAAPAIRDRIKEFRRVPASDLRPNAKNWRTHGDEQRAALAGVLSEIGIAGAVIARECDDGSLELIDGHLRAETLPDALVPVLVLDVTEAEADKLLVTLDPLAALAGTDGAKLSALLDQVDSESAAVTRLLADLAEQAIAAQPPVTSDVDADPQIDRAEELRQKWGVESGQLWQLGEHRLLCGDCRDSDGVAWLMRGERINVAFTSPPYAEQRAYDESSGFVPIAPSAYVDWWESVQANVAAHLAEDGSFFVNIKPAADGIDTELYVFDLVLAHVRRWGWHFATELCWERNGVPKSVTRRFKNQFEPIYQFTRGEWKMRPDAVRHASENVPMSLGKGSGNTAWQERQGVGGVIPANRRPKIRKNQHNGNMADAQGWSVTPGECVAKGLAYPGNRLPTFNSTHDALGHAAAFPVGLPGFFIKAYSDVGDLIFEPFAGSGSTLIAAEQLGRRCYAIEISASYCAVILQRFLDATGKTPALIESR